MRIIGLECSLKKLRMLTAGLTQSFDDKTRP